MNKQFILFWAFINSVCSLEKFLRFTQNEYVTERNTFYELDQTAVNVDAFLKSQILVKYNQYLSDIIFPTLNFYCQVKKLGEQYKITHAFLCKKDFIASTEDCHSVNPSINSVTFADIMKFDIKFDPTSGFISTLNMDLTVVKSRKKPFNGFYYCKLSNGIGALVSNYVEIQDFEFYKKKLSDLIKPIATSFTPTHLNDIRADSLPIYLDCGKSVGDVNQDLPKWAINNIISPFAWNFCPGSVTGINCYTMVVDNQKKLSKPLNEYVDYYQYPNGTIVLLSVKSSDYVKSGIICTSRPLKPYAIYLKKDINNSWLPINIDKSDVYRKKIETISPLNSEITIREGTYKVSKVKLHASYVANPDHNKKTANWFKNKYDLPSTFAANAYELTFPSEITKEHSGKYTLNITQSDIKDEVIFTFDVKVVGVPSLKKGLLISDPIYRMVDQSVNLSVIFEGDVSKTALEINGVVIESSSSGLQAESLKSLFSKFIFLNGMTASWNPGDMDNRGMITYKASNLHTNKDTPHTKTHSVTFIAENDVGISKASYLIRVFESPIFTNYLDSNNCTESCKSTEKHVFKCSIDTFQFTQEDLQVNYIWNLNGYTLNNMDKSYIQKDYLNINGDTVELQPIIGEDSEKNQKMAAILKNATLSCQVLILEPQQTIHNPPRPRNLYNSDDYPDVKQRLKARIIIDVNTIAKASSSWILALVISLIVLVILVIVILYFCLRGSGETYNVDQKERAQGYDPEKEIRDNETFQPYERDHDNSVMLPSRLSFNDDDSVGVGSEDGELDVYDIDPGKFNEEGSFIGQYASDPRKSKTVPA